MPHFIVESSAGVEQMLSSEQLLEAVLSSAVESGLFPLSDIKVRLIRPELCFVGGSDLEQIHVTVKMFGGRNEYQRQQLMELVLNRLMELPLSLVSMSVEVVEIDSSTSYLKKVIG